MLLINLAIIFFHSSLNIVFKTLKNILLSEKLAFDLTFHSATLCVGSSAAEK